MSSTYSNSLRIELIGTGDQAGTWGTTTDNNFAYIFDTAIAGYQTVSISSASQALTYLNGPTSSATANQSIYAMLRLTTTTGANFAVYAPPVSKTYIIYNNSGYTATIYNSTVIGNTTAAGSGVAITDGTKLLVFSDGTNFYTINAANLTGTLAIANGGTGQTTQQAALNALVGTQVANRVLRSNGTNSTLSQVDLTTDVTGTLPVASGGTGATAATGTGNVVLASSPTISSPTLTTPVLGTPASGNLANCTFPTLNQNTTGTAAGLSSTLGIAGGGTGATTASAAAIALGVPGYNQTWQTPSRTNGVTYTNSTSAPITVCLSGITYGTTVSIGGVGIGGSPNNSNYYPYSVTFVVPVGSTYIVNVYISLGLTWAELR
jgi:hypothetical protein